MALNWFKKKQKNKDQKNDTESDLPQDMTNGDDQGSESDSAETAELSLFREDNSQSPATDDRETPRTETRIPPETSADDEYEQPSRESGKSGGGLFAKLKRGLSKTRDILTTDIEDLFSGKSRLDDDMLEDIEEMLITSDIGVQTTMQLVASLSKKASKINNSRKLMEVLKEEILDLVNTGAAQQPQAMSAEKPHVVMVIGVNGVGKTTTIGKLAAKKVQEGQKVMIAAADTFRAAAIDQLAVWAERSGADIIKHKENADPAAVVFDGMQAAKARGVDTLFVDTAGRLHTKVNLMEELKKIHRTITKQMPTAPHEILLVLDATTGQNAISQAKLFHESIGITGLALTKLDGTAKGGIVVSICRDLQLPLHYIGVGEGIEDLQQFDAAQFVDALF